MQQESATAPQAGSATRAGNVVIDALRAEGVKHLFGLVGSHVIGIYDALADAPDLRHITVKHETTATTMADAYARVTGEVGVALVTAGPGATNSITGVAQAYMAASPMVHISGTVPTTAPLEDFHGVDRRDTLVRMFADITKWSTSVQNPDDLPETLARAFAIARSGRPGPVHVEIPNDLLQAAARVYPAYTPQAVTTRTLDSAALDGLTTQIRSAQRIVIWAGKGVRATQAQAELAELAELLEAPVVQSGDAAGAISDDHPLSTGNLSLYGRTPLQEELVAEADLVLAIGERGGTGHANGMFTLAAAGSTPVAGIWLANDGEEADARSVAGAAADIRSGLNQLVEALGDQQRTQDSGLRERILAGRDGLRERIMQEANAGWDTATGAPMPYSAALDALAAQVDDEMIVLGDIGSHNQWSRMALRSLHPNGFVPEGYWGAMGFGLPAAMAAKLAFPERRVITVTGDGCFLMSSADFSTAVESGLNPVILILNDRRYGMIVGMQEGAFGRQFATELDGPDFVAFARAFGADGVRVEHPDEMPAALEQGFNSKTIFVIDAICDYKAPHYRMK